MAKSKQDPTLNIWARYERNDAGELVYVIRERGTARQVGPEFADREQAEQYVARQLAETVKGKRRTVYPTAEIPHLWAHQALPFAKNPHGNLYFDRGTIYSYGIHFPIAKHIGWRGKQAVLFTHERNSYTTNGHINSVRWAIPPDVPVFTGPVRLDPTSYDWAIHYRDTVALYIEQAAKARADGRRPYWAEQAQNWANEAKAFSEFFGVPVDVPAIPDNYAGLAKRMRQERAAEQARKKAELRAAAEPIAARWRAGENFDSWTNDRYYLQAWPTMLRIQGAEVETSRGARVPVEHARLALRTIRTLRDSGQLPWRGGTIRLGHYRVDAIDANGTVHAGCHVIQWAEIERIAPELERIQPQSESAMAEVSHA